MPVRGALQQLETEGLVVLRSHNRVRVVALDYTECEDMYKMGERLEPLALSQSIADVAEEQIGHAVRHERELAQLRDYPAVWLDGDRKFHPSCYAGVRTPRLLRTLICF